LADFSLNDCFRPFFKASAYFFHNIVTQGCGAESFSWSRSPRVTLKSVGATKIWSFGDWSFGERSPSENGRSENGRLPPEIGRSEIGRSEIGRSEIGRSENGRSENGRCTGVEP
jgi:hypothetical protein